MKKTFPVIILLCLLCAGLICGCGKETKTSTPSEISSATTGNETSSLNEIQGNEPKTENDEGQGKWLALFAITDLGEEPTAFKYDSEYRVISEETTGELTCYEYGEGVIPSRSMVYEIDYMGNPASEAISVTEYDKYGNEISIRSYEEGTPQVVGYTYQYSEAGLPVACTIASLDPEGTQDITSCYFSYDEQNNVTEIVYYDTDGVTVTERHKYDYTVCGDKYLVKSVLVVMSDEETQFKLSYSFEYDEDGELSYKHFLFEYEELGSGEVMSLGNYSFSFPKLVYPENPIDGQKCFRNVTVTDDEDGSNWNFEEEYIYVNK